MILIKKLFFSFAFMSLLTGAQASAKALYFQAQSKLCDGQALPVEDGEIIMIDLSQSEIGLGQRKENGCTTVDVMSMLTTKPRSKANPTVFMETVETKGQKSSCGSSKSSYQGINFMSARIKSHQVILRNTDDCNELVITIQ